MRTALLATVAASITMAFACGDDTTGASSGGGDGGGKGGGALAGPTSGDGGDDDDGPVCERTSCEDVPTFSELPWDQCTSCHSSDEATRAAQGVPSDSDYTKASNAVRDAKEIAKRSDEGHPETEPLSNEDREAFEKWGCCDAPQ